MDVSITLVIILKYLSVCIILFFSIIYFLQVKKRRTLKKLKCNLLTLDYRKGLASVNKHASAVYLSSFKLEIRFRCFLSVFVVIG
ncbi:hypothetical protein ALC57_19002 [Trachymyrmex cornetzi]|uniref:Uncharacterized protein n=1 Tax=Trachymyrmex cornetzi TaxID=471704 RepID=A0A195D9F7_9HYME|nr:hypothetical protein ALC57_19002 [Trachymyrmex cornetzi]